MLIVSLLIIPLGPISIPAITVGPYQTWTEGTADLNIQRDCWYEVYLPSLASNVETREESTICLQVCDLFLASWPLLCLMYNEQRQFNLWHNVTQWFVGCTFQPVLHTNSLNWLWPIYSTAFTVCVASLFMTTFVSRVSMSPLSSRNVFPCPQMLPTGSTLSYSLLLPISLLSSSMHFELCQLSSDFHCGHFFKFKMAVRYHVDSNIGTTFNIKLYITIYMAAKFRYCVINTFWDMPDYRHSGRPF